MINNIKNKIMNKLKVVFGSYLIHNGLLPKVKIGKYIIPFQIKYIFKIPIPIPFWYFSLFSTPGNSIKRKHYAIRDKLENNSIKRKELEKIYEKYMGFRPNFDNPVMFTEKLNYLKLNYENHLITKCCDKFTVKEYITQYIGEKYMVPNINNWNDIGKINFDELPNKFVLKVNWSSGYNILINNKQDIKKSEWNLIIKQLDLWMKPESNSYYDAFNWGYKDMMPVIFAEEYLDIPNNSTEYKVFCFNGKVKFVLVELDYFGKKPKRAYYNKEWQEMPFQFGNIEKVKIDNPPETYNKIIELAERLAKPFPYIRVDFYDIKGNLYIGEMTFYSGGGFSKIKPYDYDVELGKDLDLTEAMEKVKKGVL